MTVLEVVPLMQYIVRFNYARLYIIIELLYAAYAGRFCEEDRNGCSEIQCYVETDCLDIPAPGVGEECGPCPPGFTGQGEKCLGVYFRIMDSYRNS